MGISAGVDLAEGPASEVGEARADDRQFYDEEVDYFSHSKLPAFLEHVRVHAQYLRPIEKPLRQLRLTRDSLDVVELGAGTCLTALSLRKLVATTSLTCVDISAKRMAQLSPQVAALIGASAEEVRYVEADFSYRLPLQSQSYDLVVFDAALHHSCNIWLTLAECHRILRPGGVLLGLREAYLAHWTSSIALNRILRSTEVAAGVAENAYLRGQYDYWLRANGFRPRFYPVAPTLTWKLLAPLNGYVFSKWSIWAERTTLGIVM